MKLISRPMLFLVCLVGLALSIALNLFLFYQVKHYYSEVKLSRIFPYHRQTYKAQNLTLLSKPKKRARVVLFGDSRIDQWNPAPNIKHAEIINRGISGETTVQLKYRMQQDVTNLDPDIVVLQIGINDLVAIGVAPKVERRITQQTKENILQMVDQLIKQDVMVFLLTIISPSKPSLMRLPVWSERISIAVQEINTQLLILPHHEKLNIVDTDKVLSDKDNRLNNIYFDTLHLSVYGYRKLNVAIENLINKNTFYSDTGTVQE